MSSRVCPKCKEAKAEYLGRQVWVIKSEGVEREIVQKTPWNGFEKEPIMLDMVWPTDKLVIGKWNNWIKTIMFH